MIRFSFFSLFDGVTCFLFVFRYSPQFMFDGKEYPDYVSGTGYVMSGKIVPALFENALQVPLFHLEDIFITGMVARKTKIVPENYNLFSYLKQPLDNPCLYRKIITSHGLTPSEMKTVWQRVNNVTLDCSAVKLPKIGDAKMKTCKKAKKVAAKKAAILNVHRGWNETSGAKYPSWSLAPLSNQSYRPPQL